MMILGGVARAQQRRVGVARGESVEHSIRACREPCISMRAAASSRSACASWPAVEIAEGPGINAAYPFGRRSTTVPSLVGTTYASPHS